MDQNIEILDISSDEEADTDEPIEDDYSWLTRLLFDEDDDSDEVVVVREVKSKSSKPAISNEEDDGDCVVLDGDPDKAVEAVDDQASDGDELFIVGQKGQIACRDYPHPRHDCAKFPFSSTAHDLHCDQCHCYVCDKIAPCSHWGTGVCNNDDHCHATSKEAFWKSQRESFRMQKDAPVLVPKVPDTSLSTALPQLNQTPPLDIIQLKSNSTTQTRVCRPAVLRPCSSAPRFGVPNIISQGSRSRQPGLVFNRSRFETHSVSQPPLFLRVRNNVIRKDRGQSASSTGMLKRDGIAGGAWATNGRRSYGMLSTRKPAPQSISNGGIQIGSVPSMNKDSCTYQNTSETFTASVFASTVPSQPQVYNHPIPDPQAYSQLITQQPIYSQPILEPQVYSQPIPEPQVYSQPIPEPQVYGQPFPQPQLLGQAISQPQMQSQSIPQSQVYIDHIPLSNDDDQNVSQLCNQRQGSNFSNLDEWVNISQNNRQPEIKNCQLNRTGSTNETVPVKEFNPQCNGSDDFHCNDFEIPNWFPENDPIDMVSEGYVPSNLNVASPEPANFDEGMHLFDFETSWNGHSQALF